MKFETVDDIFTTNAKLRERFRTTVSAVTDDEAKARPDGEEWSIAEIVEHVSIVDAGIARICAKLLDGAKAAGKASDGSLAITEKFRKGAARIANEKLQAPDRVRPTGEVSIASALATMDATATGVEGLREDFAKVDLSATTFPHPYLGDMTAAEWLVMYGGHQARHAAQIERILEKIRQ